MNSLLALITGFFLSFFTIRQPTSPTIRQPLGTIGQSAQSLQYIVDQEGLVFDQASASALPLLLVDKAPRDLSQTELSSLKILNLLASLLTVRVIGRLQDKILFVQTPTTQFLFDPTDHTDSWYTSLQLILGRSRIDGKIPHKIDMRYANPVITY